MNVSIVVPTFNRGPKLRSTLQSILETDIRGVHAVDIIVVDDGSLISAKEVLMDIVVPPPFSLHLVRQENQGPAVARNA